MNPFGAYRGSAAAQTTAQQWGNARGGELIGQGISQGGEALARGIEQMKALSTEAKSLRQLAKVYDPENAAKYDAMGLGELRGAVKGYALKQAIAEHAARMKAYEAEVKQREVETRQREEEMRRNEDTERALRASGQINDISGAMGALGRVPGFGAAGQMQVDPSEALRRAAERVGSVKAWELANERQQQGNRWNLAPGQAVPLPGGGTGVATTSNSIQIPAAPPTYPATTPREQLPPAPPGVVWIIKDNHWEQQQQNPMYPYMGGVLQAPGAAGAGGVPQYDPATGRW